MVFEEKFATAIIRSKPLSEMRYCSKEETISFERKKSAESFEKTVDDIIVIRGENVQCFHYVMNFY
jgi:hypothetical protein